MARILILLMLLVFFGTSCSRKGYYGLDVYQTSKREQWDYANNKRLFTHQSYGSASSGSANESTPIEDGRDNSKVASDTPGPDSFASKGPSAPSDSPNLQGYSTKGKAKAKKKERKKAEGLGWSKWPLKKNP